MPPPTFANVVHKCAEWIVLIAVPDTLLGGSKLPPVWPLGTEYHITRRREWFPVSRYQSVFLGRVSHGDVEVGWVAGRTAFTFEILPCVGFEQARLFIIFLLVRRWCYWSVLSQRQYEKINGVCGRTVVSSIELRCQEHLMSAAVWIYRSISPTLWNCPASFRAHTLLPW